jgi:hypothetical protein
VRLSKKLAASVSIVAAGTLAAGVAFAAWTASGSGSGTAQATSAVALTTEAATNAADLYPGATVALNIKIKNDNPYPVRVTEVNLGTGSILSGDSACDLGNGVSYASQTGLTFDIAAGASTSFSVPSSVHMSNSSANACQGKTFTIPVNLVGASNAAS